MPLSPSISVLSFFRPLSLLPFLQRVFVICLSCTPSMHLPVYPSLHPYGTSDPSKNVSPSWQELGDSLVPHAAFGSSVMWVDELCLLSERAVPDGHQHCSGAQTFPDRQQVDSRTRVSWPCHVLFWHLYLRVLLKLKTDHTSGYTETKIQVFPFLFLWFRKPISN